MACYHPLRARLVEDPEGKTLDFKAGWGGKPLSLPCGRCIGCRLERTRQWAVRLMHEAKMHDDTAYITLTLRENPPACSECKTPHPAGSLCVKTCQLFMKKLRARVAPVKIRFFLSGEYGEQFGRPHYHGLIFGFGFPDRKPITSRSGHTVYSSKLLGEVWGLGDTELGEITFDSAAYCAGYVTKKINGEKAKEHYGGKLPEFSIMSRRPGIGRSWFDAYSADVFPSDEIIVRGVKSRPPRYYDNVQEESDAVLMGRIREKRELHAQKLEDVVFRNGYRVQIAPSRNGRRLQVREVVAKAKQKLKEVGKC